MTTFNILIVDDDRDFAESLKRAIESENNQIVSHPASSITEAISLQKKFAPLVVLLDLSLSTTTGVQEGFAVLSKLLQNDRSVRIIVLTGHGSDENGIRAIKQGAAHFIQKPPYIPHLVALISDGIEHASLKRRAFRNVVEKVFQGAFIGPSRAMQHLKNEIEFAASNELPVFLHGETGTGKTLCASIIHKSSELRNGRFISYQPSFANSDLVNSDLFGHKKGAFTGAADERKGLLLEAHSGTLFLDEVNELPKETQITFLNVLQSKKFRPVGGNQEIASQFRLISASNVDINRAVEEGGFRKDLLYRISSIEINLPPLRERKEDILPLSQFFLDSLSGQRGYGEISLTEEAQALFIAHDWPGNIRELSIAIENAVHRAQFKNSSTIQPSDLQLRGAKGPVSISSFHHQLEVFKQKLISEALAKACGNQSEAAKLLEMDRTSFRRILKDIS